MEKFDPHKFNLTFGFKPKHLFIPDETLMFKISQEMDLNHGLPLKKKEYGSLKDGDKEVFYCFEVTWKNRSTDGKLVHEIENIILFHDLDESSAHQWKFRV